MEYVTDEDLSKILKPGTVLLIKIDEVGSQLSNLKNDLKNHKNVKLIYENGRNHRMLDDLIRTGYTPVLLMGKSTMNSTTDNVKRKITHVLKPSQYVSEEAAEMFIF
jgi:uncharacterized membrane-anchored protein